MIYLDPLVGLCDVQWHKCVLNLIRKWITHIIFLNIVMLLFIVFRYT